MKKIFLLAAAIFIYAGAWAQEYQQYSTPYQPSEDELEEMEHREFMSGFKRNEFIAGVGYLGSTHAYEGIASFFNNVFSSDTYYEYRRMPLVQAAYKNRISKRSSFGATFVWGQSRYIERQHAGSAVRTTRSLINNYYSIAGEYEVRYIVTHGFAMNGNFGMGLTFYREQLEEGRYGEYNAFAYPDYQISPLGFKWGDSVGGFLEMGFGYKGFISGGLFVRF